MRWSRANRTPPADCFAARTARSAVRTYPEPLTTPPLRLLFFATSTPSLVPFGTAHVP